MTPFAPFRFRRRVEFRDTDAAGIAHFTAFFAYLEEAEHALLRSVGLSVVLQRPDGTISWPRVSAHCDFRGAARFEEELSIDVRIERLGTKSVTYGFVVRSGERELAAGTMTSVCCRIVPHQPPQSIEIPDWFAERLRPFVAPSLDQ